MSGRRTPRSFKLVAASTRILWTLSLLFLFAQWGALAHAYSHYDAPVTSAKHTHEKPCGQCQDFAPLLAGASAHGFSLDVDFPESSVPRDDLAPLVHDSSLTLSFRSRAPPATR